MVHARGLLFAMFVCGTMWFQNNVNVTPTLLLEDSDDLTSYHDVLFPLIILDLVSASTHVSCVTWWRVEANKRYRRTIFPTFIAPYYLLRYLVMLCTRIRQLISTMGRPFLLMRPKLVQSCHHVQVGDVLYLLCRDIHPIQ